MATVRGKPQRPSEIKTPDLRDLRFVCETYMVMAADGEHEEDLNDAKTNIFETAIQMFYGEGVFEDYLNRLR